MSQQDELDVVLHLFDELDPEDREALEGSVSASPELQRRHRRWSEVIDTYRSIPDEERPTNDFGTCSADHRRPRPHEFESVVGAPRLRWLQIAALVALVVGAFFAGRITVRDAEEPNREELAELAAETDQLRREVERIALSQRRAVDRIAAIDSWIAAGGRDRNLAAEIWRALRDDPSVNVRLSAIDAAYVMPEIVPDGVDLAAVVAAEPAVSVRLALLGWLAATRPDGWQSALSATRDSDPDVAIRDAAAILLSREI